MAYTDEQINEVMDEFFDTMNHVQYVGTRYAPIFGRKDEESIDWDNSKPYEPLTIVLYRGSSYTSRQSVPVGIEITNALYWAETGNYNAQIEAYRTEVERYKQEVIKNKDDINEIKHDITSINESIYSIEADVDSLQNEDISLHETDTALDNKITNVQNNVNREAISREEADGILENDIYDISTFLPSNYVASPKMKDYIVEQGTVTTTGINVSHSCQWLYRKWASGIAECWGRHQESFNCNQDWGELKENYATVVEVFPSGLFSNQPWFCHMGWNGIWLLCFEYGGGLTNERSQDFRAVRATTGEIEGTLMVYAMGTWK